MKPSLRIGILTYHYVFNEGALWQAVSLCRAIREKYPQHQCEIIDYRHQQKYDSLRRYIPEAKEILFNEALKDCLGKTRIIDDGTSELFAHLSATYDLVIVGSDIIWQFDRKRSLCERVCCGIERTVSFRPDRSTPYRFLRDVKNWLVGLRSTIMEPDPLKIPFPNAYWLDPDGDYKKCTFAASVGYSDVDNIPVDLKPEMVRHLDALDFISVRDQASRRFVQGLVPQKAESARVTPDPTWLFNDPPMNVDDLFERYGLTESDRLAGVLFSPHRYYGERLNAWVLPLLKEKGFKTVSVVNGNSNVDVNLAGECLHPFAWWGVIARLDFLFTVRTHPTIAALKYGTPFANVDITAMINRSQHSKSRDLLETFSQEDCCIFRRADFSRNKVTGLIEHSLTRSWDWEAVARQREANRMAGLETLSSIIEEGANG